MISTNPASLARYLKFSPSHVHSLIKIGAVLNELRTEHGDSDDSDRKLLQFLDDVVALVEFSGEMEPDRIYGELERFRGPKGGGGNELHPQPE